MVNVKDLRVRYHYYYAGTSDPVNVKTNVTYQDIDNSQAMSFRATSVYSALVTDKPASVLRYSYDDGWHVFVDPDNTDASGAEDPQCSCSVAFRGQWLDVKYTSNQTTVGLDEKVTLGNPNGADSYFSPSQYTLFLPEPGNDSLEKAMYDDDESNVPENRIRNRKQKWKAVITQMVPAGYSTKANAIQRFIIKDEMADIVDVRSAVQNRAVRVTNIEGTDLTNQFIYSYSGSTFKAEAKQGLLRQEKAFYQSGWGNVIRIEITVGLKEGLTDEDLEPYYNETRTELRLPNTPSCEIDNFGIKGKQRGTILELPMPEDPGDPDDEIPGLSVTKMTEPYEFQTGDRIHYKILITQGISIKALKGVFDLTCPLLRYGETITVTFDAVPSAGCNGTVIKNTVYAKAFGVPELSDSTSVYINSPKMDIEKRVTKEKNEYKNGDQINYEVEIRNINKGTFMRDIFIVDTFESPGLVFDKGSLTVEDANGRILTAGQDYDLFVYGEGAKQVDGYPLDLSDIRAGDSGSILPSGNHGGFLVRMKGAYRNMGWEDLYIPPFDDERGKTVMYSGSEKPDYEDLQLIDYLKISYNVTVEYEGPGDPRPANFIRVPATYNTNGQLIRDDDTIPSGGDHSEVTSGIASGITGKGPEKEEIKPADPPAGHEDPGQPATGRPYFPHVAQTGDREMFFPAVLAALISVIVMSIAIGLRRE